MTEANNISLIDIISIAGTIITCIGTYISYKEANKSISAAKKAENIKIQLIGHRQTSELSELKTLLLSAKKSFDKYQTTPSSSLVGMNFSTDADVINCFNQKLKEYREHFYIAGVNVADSTYMSIQSELDLFISSTDTNENIKHAKSILHYLVNFLPSLKQVADLKNEATV